MISGSLSRRYAKALLQIGREDEQVEKIDGELAKFGELLTGSKELAAMFVDPTILPSAKQAIVKELVEKLALSDTTKSFIQLLGDKGRLGFFADIHREFRRLADDDAGRAQGTVTSAAPLTDDMQKSLVEKFSKVTGRKVELTQKVDPGLLGGLVAEIGGIVYDGSLRTQLRRLRDSARGQG